MCHLYGACGLARAQNKDKGTIAFRLNVTKELFPEAPQEFDRFGELTALTRYGDVAALCELNHLHTVCLSLRATGCGWVTTSWQSCPSLWEI
jgi:hypothetical protein